jgi:hypothetical protein
MQQPRKTFAVPTEQAAEPEQRGSTPVEVAAYIRFQLSELAGTNAHHEFEQLCFQLARKRIHPNIIPSTGPVSAGGDQGSDFETFEIGSPEGSPFFAAGSDGKIIFACSIEKQYKKKIKNDLALIAKAQPSATKVKFFSNGSIPKGIRHKLQTYAKGAHGIELEVFDSFAISELLADHEVLWIAIRFLSIPGELFLASPAASEADWYEDAKKLQIGPDQPSVADFLTIKRAVRYATGHHSLQSDLPLLINKLRIFQAHQLTEIARRAFYEEFVASLRGLEFLKDCADGLQGYFAAVPELIDAAEMQDAAVLLHYAIGAHNRGLLDMPLSQVLYWRRSLIDRTVSRFGDVTSPG